MFFKYKPGDIVRCSLSEEENYILVIKKREFYKKYSGTAAPLDTYRIGPGRNKYQISREDSKLVNKKVCHVKFFPETNMEKRVKLENIHEKYLSVINSSEIDISNFLGEGI
ncbi:MAG: hypothetical protein AABW81_01100 [Nanoarchaeota archaeon]